MKKVATILGFKMTKDVFAKGIGKIIPIIGGVVSGSLTFATYMPMAKKLQNYLSGLKPADVKYYQDIRQNEKPEYLEVEFTEKDYSNINEDLKDELDQEKTEDIDD